MTSSLADTKELKGLIDAHCHLTDERVWSRAEEWIRGALDAGVHRMMLGGLEPAEWQRQKVLLARHPQMIRTSFGLHPWWVERYSESKVNEILVQLDTELHEADALGETGLDFHARRDSSKFDLQRFAFKEQLRLARKHSKPLVLHVVKAHAEALEMVKNEALGLPILVHSFSGSGEEALAWCQIGACLSFSGGVLIPRKFEKTKAALRRVPLDRLLIETDSPDQSWREGFNEPRLIFELYEGIAAQLGVEIKTLVQIVNENFKNFG